MSLQEAPRTVHHPASRRASSASRLDRFLARLARDEQQRSSLEDALLGHRFVRYAARRLAMFASTRLMAAITCAVEYLLLSDLFSDRAMMLSLSLQNLTFALDAIWWGALESLRRALRLAAERRDTGEQAAIERWLTSATWLSILAVAGWVGWRAHSWRQGRPLNLLDAYAGVCALRLVCDVLLQTLHAGVWAHHRVRRPLYWAVLMQPLGFVGILVLERHLGTWSFPLAAFVAVVASRAVYLVYVVRAYRSDRRPLPRLRLRWVRSRLDEPPSLVQAAAGALAQLAGRQGTLLVLAALLPSLAHATNETGAIDPWVLALHLAGPLLQGASSWALVFYHDVKGLDSDAADLLRRRLFTRLTATAIVTGTVSWALAATAMPLVHARLHWLQLLPLFLALALTSLAQLWTFARGALLRLLVGSLASAVVVYRWHAAHVIDANLLALASVGGALLTLLLLLAGVGRQRWGLFRRESQLRRALERCKQVRVGVLSAPRASAAGLDELARWLTARIGRRGGAVRRRNGVAWFVDESAGKAPLIIDGAALAVASGGLVSTIDARPVMSGAAAARQLAPAAPSPDELHARFVQQQPHGVVADLRRRPPAWLRALSPELRREIWRDASAAAVGARNHRSRLGVSVALDAGRIRFIFASNLPLALVAVAARGRTDATPPNVPDAPAAADRINEPQRSAG